MDRQRQGQKGFTLIEIIAVIVLLGVLAAVLVPKFTNLTQDAKVAALQQAVAEGQARVNAAAAKYILSSGSVPTSMANLGTLDGAAGDYTIAYGDALITQDGFSGVQLTVTDKDDNSATGFAPLPVGDTTT